MIDKIRGHRQEARLVFEDTHLIDKEEFNQIIENFINIGHLNGTIPEDQIWLSSKGFRRDFQFFAK